MPTNFYFLFIVALIPMCVGAIYYHPKVAGNVWMRTNGFTEDSLKGGNMALILGLCYFFSLILSLGLMGIVIHQMAVYQVMMPEIEVSGSDAQTQFNDFMAIYGNNFRTFGHGALHGMATTLIIVLPLIAINALFERRGWKYIAIHTVYWLITLMLMGGILCKTLVFAAVS